MQASIPVRNGLILLSFIASVPCVYIRQYYRKYSFMWFLLIHLPIPFIVLMRFAAGVDWHVIPLTLCGALAGQVVGGGVKPRRKR